MGDSCYQGVAGFGGWYVIWTASCCAVGSKGIGGYSSVPHHILRGGLSGLSCSSIRPSLPRMTAIDQ